MLIYRQKISYLYFYGRGLKGRAGCRKTEVQTSRQADRQTDDLCLLSQRIGEHVIDSLRVTTTSRV